MNEIKRKCSNNSKKNTRVSGIDYFFGGKKYVRDIKDYIKHKILCPPSCQSPTLGLPCFLKISFEVGMDFERSADVTYILDILCIRYKPHRWYIVYIYIICNIFGTHFPLSLKIHIEIFKRAFVSVFWGNHFWVSKKNTQNSPKHLPPWFLE